MEIRAIRRNDRKKTYPPAELLFDEIDQYIRSNPLIRKVSFLKLDRKSLQAKSRRERVEALRAQAEAEIQRLEQQNEQLVAANAQLVQKLQKVFLKGNF